MGPLSSPCVANPRRGCCERVNKRGRAPCTGWLSGSMDPVTAAFRAVPRAGFLPRRDRMRAGVDGPIQIGHGQTNSQPRTVEAMLRLLEVRPGDRVLDVGAGSGWTTALLAHLTGEQGSVTGVELVPALATWGAENLANAAYPHAPRSALPSRASSAGRRRRRTTGSWSRPTPGGCPRSSSTSSGRAAGSWCRYGAR